MIELLQTMLMRSSDQSQGLLCPKKCAEGFISSTLSQFLLDGFRQYCAVTEKYSLVENVWIPHQFPIHDVNDVGVGMIDITVCYRYPKAFFPFAFFEITTGSTTPKLAQAFAYAKLLFASMRHSKLIWTPLLGIIMSGREIVFKIYVLTMSPEKETKIAVIDLLSIKRREMINSEDLLRLLDVLTNWVWRCHTFLSFGYDAQKYSSRLLPRANNNVLFYEGRVFKSFDYRSGNRALVTPEDRRSPNYYDLLDDYRMEVDAGDLKIISYKKVDGTHQPSRLGHFTNLFQQLQKLHQKDIIHGDIRLSNIIFSILSEEEDAREPSATIIDYDFSGAAGKKRYPPGYNRDINDGQRHPDAISRNPLQPEHDVFSCLFLCRLYSPLDQILAVVELSIVAILTRLLEEDQNQSLLPVVGLTVDVPSGQGTGSPPRIK